MYWNNIFKRWDTFPDMSGLYWDIFCDRFNTAEWNVSDHLFDWVKVLFQMFSCGFSPFDMNRALANYMDDWLS